MPFGNKPRAMAQFGINVEHVGHSRTISCPVTESAHKHVKDHLTNNAAVAMAADQDF